MVENADPILGLQRDWLDRLVLRSYPTVADVGANEGRFAAEILMRWPSARVVCFEPQPVAASRIPTRAERRVVALGDRRETLKLYCDPNRGVDMSASFHRPWTDGIDVPVERLDEQELRHIDLLKVDAEGNEFAVMRGAGDLLRPDHIPIVQWEYNNFQQEAGVTFEDFRQLLVPRGYAIRDIREGGVAVEIDEEPAWNTGAEHYELVAVAA